MIHVTSIESGLFAPIFDRAGRVPAFPIAAGLWRELIRGLFDPYRPELHYMRGPGPKWREKHGVPHATRSDAMVRTLRGATA